MSRQTVEQAEQRQAGFDRTVFGFWVYLMTDLVLFATLFATFAVLRHATAGSESLGELFSLPFVLGETLLLLTSSFTIGMAIIAARRGNRPLTVAMLVLTFGLGAGFLAMELHEFSQLSAEGNSWRTNGALSAFFTLVGTHGAHIASGLLWIAVMGIQTLHRGLSQANVRRLTLLSLFWHFLDIVWIFIFTIVYLLGTTQ